MRPGMRHGLRTCPALDAISRILLQMAGRLGAASCGDHQSRLGHWRSHWRACWRSTSWGCLHHISGASWQCTLKTLPASSFKIAEVLAAGSRGDHRSRLRGELLERLLDYSALELLAVMAQHTTRVRLPGCHLTSLPAASLRI